MRSFFGRAGSPLGAEGTSRAYFEMLRAVCASQDPAALAVPAAEDEAGRYRAKLESAIEHLDRRRAMLIEVRCRIEPTPAES